MPLDIESHWSWNNPLNIIPAFLLLVVLLAVASLVMSAIGAAL